jgi:hypothetical protein
MLGFDFKNTIRAKVWLKNKLTDFLRTTFFTRIKAYAKSLGDYLKPNVTRSDLFIAMQQHHANIGVKSGITHRLFKRLNHL